MFKKFDQILHSYSVAKTKYLCVGADDNDNNILELVDNIINGCNSYKYLGVTFNKEGTDNEEIDNRIVMARKAIGCLNGILWNKNKLKRRKYNIYEAIIKCTLLYASET